VLKPRWSTKKRVVPRIILTDDEKSEWTTLVRSKRTSVRLAQRALIVLLADQGKQTIAIAAELGIGRVQVARWRERYAEARLAGIERDLPRGAPPVKVDVTKLVSSEPGTGAGSHSAWTAAEERPRGDQDP
jgi:transposase